MINKLYSLYKFTRPHTLHAAIISMLSIYIKIIIIDNIYPNIYELLNVIFIILSGSFFCVGINQLFDIEIDKINKPYLPLAAGELSYTQGLLAVLLSLFLGIMITFTFFPQRIFIIYCIALSIGAIYSIPYTNIRDYPYISTILISIDRGFFLNFITYSSLTQKSIITMDIGFIISFTCIMLLVIGTFKDIPDVTGDIKNNRSSFAIKYGVKNIFNYCVYVLISNYIIHIMVTLFYSDKFNIYLIIPYHIMLASYLFYKWYIYNYDNDNYTNFYMFIWKLFYAEYLIYPFIFY